MELHIVLAFLVVLSAFVLLEARRVTRMDTELSTKLSDLREDGKFNYSNLRTSSFSDHVDLERRLSAISLGMRSSAEKLSDEIKVASLDTKTSVHSSINNLCVSLSDAIDRVVSHSRQLQDEVHARAHSGRQPRVAERPARQS